MTDDPPQPLSYESKRTRQRVPLVGPGVCFVIMTAGLLAILIGAGYLRMWQHRPVRNSGDFGLGIVVCGIGLALVLGSALMLRAASKRNRPGG